MERPGKLKTLIRMFDLRYLNSWNNMRSSLGFTRSLFLPRRSADNLDQIFNFLMLTPSLSSSGQPTESQFQLIAKAGFTTVINLAPHGAENALADEALLLKELGLHYIHIPVNFKQPSDWDYKRFCHAMKEAGDNPVWVHCAANMRVSAFLYRYRIEKLGEDEDVARRDMEKIWTPFGVWKGFIEGRAA